MEKGSTYIFDKGVYLRGTGTAVGRKEGEGPLGKYFDRIYEDNYCGEKSFEKAEQHLLDDAISIALVNSALKENEIDLALSGDLINQNITSNYVMRDYNIPFFAMYGACSTSMQTLLAASLLINSGQFNNIVVSASSHNATAERQYRYPTEYGVKRPETTTFTVTGAGSAVASSQKSSIRITSGTIGRVIDAKQNDPNDMGTAMAPAASDTIIRHLRELNIKPDYYDMIITGDLSKIGSNILVDIMNKEGYSVEKLHHDCGKLIFTDEQQTFSGGSGCACCAVVTYGYIKNLLDTNQVKRVLVVATGALLNPIIMLQKETIPSIAHAVAFEKCE